MPDTSNISPSTNLDDEIDLRVLFRVLWRGKLLIMGASMVVAVIAIIASLFLPDIYRSEALLAPNEQDGAGGASSLAAQYGGLAALAGINLSGQGANKTALGLKVLESRKFLTEFIQRRSLFVPLMAARGWDEVTGQLAIDPGVYDAAQNRWVGSGNTSSEFPSMQEAHEEFLDLLTVVEDRNTGFVTISLEHYSPEIAKQWVDWLIEDLNQTVMRQDVTEAEQAIQYLKSEIEKTSLAEMQRAFFNLIEEQTKVVMLARVSPEYVFRTIDPAVVPEERSKPNRILIALAGLILGGLVGCALVIVRQRE